MIKQLLFVSAAVIMLAFNACKNSDLSPEPLGDSTVTPIVNPLASANWNNAFTSNINFYPAVNKPLSNFGGGSSMCTDAAGNIYIVGALKGSMDADPSTGVATISQGTTTGMSLFLAKYNAAGNYLWTKVIDGNLFGDSYTKVVAPVLAVDNAGNLYLYSTFSGIANFGGNNQIESYRLDADNSKKSTYSAFLAKYSTSGTFQWGKVINDQSAISTVGRDIVGRDMQIDANGNIYIVGQYNGDLKFTNGSTSFSVGTSATYNGASPGNSAFVAKLNNSGNVIWATNLFNSNFSIANLSLDNNNDVIITGTQNGAATFTDVDGKTIFVGNRFISNTYAFVAKINNVSGGKITWFKSFTNNDDLTISSSLATNTDGSIYILGNLLYKLSSTGSVVWSKTIANSGLSSSYGKPAMTLNTNNDIIISGSYTGSITPTGATTPLTGTAKVNTYLTKYRTDGTYVWAKSYSGPAQNDVLEAYYLDTDQNNHINIYGSFSFTALKNNNNYLFLSQINDAN